MTKAFCVFAEGFSCARAYRLTQAGAVNGSRARALTARPPNLRRSLARPLNCSRWKAENHAKLEIIQFSVIIFVCKQVVFEKSHVKSHNSSFSVIINRILSRIALSEPKKVTLKCTI
ncbi:MAG: hypothetical protein IJI32_05595 [Clostridia bacterium]|nr:hypothetical protein [Clostridia bacterium]